MFDKNIKKQMEEMAGLTWNVHALATRAKESHTPIADKNLDLLLDRAYKILKHIEAVSAQLAEIKSKIG